MACPNVAGVGEILSQFSDFARSEVFKDLSLVADNTPNASLASHSSQEFPRAQLGAYGKLCALPLRCIPQRLPYPYTSYTKSNEIKKQIL